MTQVFDDRLEEVESTENLLDVAEEIARELAREHAPDEVCDHCIRDTPLACESAQDIPKMKQMRSLSRDVERKLAAVPEPNDFVRQTLNDTYIEEYHDSCGEPEDCIVCTDGTIEECGHQRHGEPCPAR